MNHEMTHLSLTHLIQIVKRNTSVLSRAQVIDAVRKLVVTEDEIASLACFSEHRYSRNLVFRDKSTEILMICWKSGQRSLIHDHAGSFGVVKILRGTLTESTFTPALNEMIKPVGSVDYRPGEVQIEDHSTIHQVSNLQPEQCDAVSIHVYLPPLKNMKIYRLYDIAPEPGMLYNYGAGI